MAGLTKVAGTLSGRLLAVAAAGGLLAAMTAAPVPARAAAGHHALRVSAVRAVTGSRPRLARRPRVVSYRPVHVSWPAAASGSIRLAGAPVPLTRAGRAGSRAASPGGVAWAAGTPVWAQPVTPPGRGVRGVRVRVLGHAAALAAGVRGVGFTAAVAGGAGGAELCPVFPGVRGRVRAEPGPGRTAGLRADQPTAPGLPRPGEAGLAQ